MPVYYELLCNSYASNNSKLKGNLNRNISSNIVSQTYSTMNSKKKKPRALRWVFKEIFFVRSFIMWCGAPHRHSCCTQARFNIFCLYSVPRWGLQTVARARAKKNKKNRNSRTFFFFFFTAHSLFSPALPTGVVCLFLIYSQLTVSLSLHQPCSPVKSLQLSKKKKYSLEWFTIYFHIFFLFRLPYIMKEKKIARNVPLAWFPLLPRSSEPPRPTSDWSGKTIRRKPPQWRISRSLAHT